MVPSPPWPGEVGGCQKAPVSQRHPLLDITGGDRNHGRLEGRRLQVERVVGSLRLRGRHGGVHQFRQDLGCIHRVDDSFRLKIPQLIGSSLALHQGQNGGGIEHRPISLIRFYALPPPAARRSIRPPDSLLQGCTYAGVPWRAAVPALWSLRPVRLLPIRRHTAQWKGLPPPSFSTRREAALYPDYRRARCHFLYPPVSHDLR